MKPIFAILLSMAAICAFISATPVVAQETTTGAPRGEGPKTTAEPRITPSHDLAMPMVLRRIGRNRRRDPQGTGPTQPSPRRHARED